MHSLGRDTHLIHRAYSVDISPFVTCIDQCLICYRCFISQILTILISFTSSLSFSFVLDYLVWFLWFWSLCFSIFSINCQFVFLWCLYFCSNFSVYIFSFVPLCLPYLSLFLEFPFPRLPQLLEDIFPKLVRVCGVPVILQKWLRTPKNLRVDTVPDPVGHFRAPWWPFWIL